MPKTTRYILLAVCILLLMLILPGSTRAVEKQEKSTGKSDISIPHQDVEKVEVLYFHPRIRCVSCNDVEKYAREVTKDEFAKEMKDGKLVFKSLEIDDPEKCKDIITSELNSVLYGGKNGGEALPLAGVPVVLAAFLLGLLTAISPCPLATNIAALSYVSKKLDNRRYTVLASALYTAGRMVAYTLIGVLLVLIGFSASRVSLFFQDYAYKILGPLLIFFGLVMLDVIKFSIFKGRITSAIQERIGDWGLVSSFLLGILFALAFCPYSAILFFGMLIPIALDSGGGVALPAIYGLGTGLPVMVFAVALSLGVSELGKHVARIQKFEKYFRWFAGVIFMGVGIYYLVILVKSFF